MHTLVRHIVLGEDVGELAGAVVTEVEEDYCIAFLYLCLGLAVGAGDNYRLYELVSYICVV